MVKQIGIEREIPGQIDIPLNQNGKDQASKTFEYLKEVNLIRHSQVQ